MSVKSAIASAVVLLSLVGVSPSANAQGFFSLFDNAFGGRASPEPPRRSMGYAPDSPYESREPSRRSGYATSGGSGSYCVRTCDGRYFPLNATGGQSKAQACNSFCPASDTKVVYGSSIDNAVTDNGRRYSDMPNAFKYRNEIVNGCTCNGKDPVGLAAIKIEDDKTLRRGDIVAKSNGLVVSGRDADGGRAALFSPASKEMQARYSSAPAAAAQ